MSVELNLTSEAAGISQTAQDYIDAQHALEIEAREILPYAFDTCTKPLGPLRQIIFACMRCTGNGSSPAGICYSCSISCHGSHGDLVELFSKRDFECDCGTTRMQGSCCSLRKTQDEIPTPGNSYNQNFQNLFCESEHYDAQNEHGTMYQCLLGDCCGEDWFHDRCILGEWSLFDRQKTDDSARPCIPEDSPVGFPDEDSFEYFICWKCVSGNPWLLNYIGTPGFLEPVVRKEATASRSTQGDIISHTRKRKASAISSDENSSAPGRLVIHPINNTMLPVPEPRASETTLSECLLQRDTHSELANKPVSLFLRSDFRRYLCRCDKCLQMLSNFKCLLEEETTYEPPLDSDAGKSTGHESLLDAGEKALGAIDRIRAIEGIMAYNTLKEKVKEFLQPFADEKRIVCQEDVKRYFEDLKEVSKATRPGNGDTPR